MKMELYDFEDAPKELQELSTNGGDEDGILVIPPDYGPIPYWVERIWSNNIDPEEITLPDGRHVIIWSHS